MISCSDVIESMNVIIIHPTAHGESMIKVYTLKMADISSIVDQVARIKFISNGVQFWGVQVFRHGTSICW